MFSNLNFLLKSKLDLNFETYFKKLPQSVILVGTIAEIRLGIEQPDWFRCV